MKVCIVYGLSEGHWHSSGLRKLLKQNGHTLTWSPQIADIIIAHSAGCFLLPENTRANLVLLVGLPRRSGRSLIKNTQEKLKRELKDLWWYQKMAFNTLYLFTQPHRWLKMMNAWKDESFPLYKGKTIVLIRNENDTYSNSDESATLASEKNWKFKTLPGHHNDLWINPGIYIEVIKEFMGS